MDLSLISLVPDGAFRQIPWSRAFLQPGEIMNNEVLFNVITSALGADGKYDSSEIAVIRRHLEAHGIDIGDYLQYLTKASGSSVMTGAELSSKLSVLSKQEKQKLAAIVRAIVESDGIVQNNEQQVLDIMKLLDEE
jgi:uncharacterized tellurite resistance protein B-like protein